MWPNEVQCLLQQVAQDCIAQQKKLVTAESCTAGGLAYALTSRAGSSAWLERGFITYSNAAKQELLGVTAVDLAQYGAVSEAVVVAMAAGALQRSSADLSIAVTGVAGPDGGSVAKPVGTVWLAWGKKLGQINAQCYYFTGDREHVRMQAIMAALKGICNHLPT